jgi:hypothetical protein
MAVPVGTVQSYTQSNGTREDLADMIYMISPQETPFLTMAKRATATNVLHEHLTDALATANTANAQIEGDDASAAAAIAVNRVKNYCQISTKTIIVSGTQAASNTAGRNELKWQLMKGSAEIKRDMESILTGNHGSSAGSASVARQLAGLEAWISTNRTSLGSAAGTTSGYATATGLVAAPTDSAEAGKVSFEVTQLKAILRECWTQGGNPQVVMAGPINKIRISGFSGIASLYREASATSSGTKIIAAADIFVHDFGEVRIVPNRFSRDRTVMCLDMDYWAVAYLRPFKVDTIAKSGDSEKRLLSVEYTLESRNQAASGKIADVKDT